MLHRRGLITGLVSLIAAPAIVRIGSIMPVRSIADIVSDAPVFAGSLNLNLPHGWYQVFNGSDWVTYSPFPQEPEFPG